MDYVFVFNAFEALLWACIAVVLCLKAMRQEDIQGRSILAALAFLVFAGSDIMEMQTGAWWRPWWLLVWKTVCIVTLVAVAVYHHRSRRPSANVLDSDE
ncbi:MAG: hypothetical protein GY903_05350 [Fuerstiella sp.]|nr:hypothetical protein [Fuerstiella sp.]MCP4853901.1 hypothetical protein [Fuerstiella sp.]